MKDIAWKVIRTIGIILLFAIVYNLLYSINNPQEPPEVQIMLEEAENADED